MKAPSPVLCAVLVCCAAGGLCRAQDSAPAVRDFSALPANTWTPIDREDGAGGKAFARVIYAESVDRLYLWGIGGKMPDRSRYLRYELESLRPTAPGWRPAFPAAVAGRWTAEGYPPFRIYGQMGTDGPRLRAVGGYAATNWIRWHEFDGVVRPSPIHTFHQACWDAQRKRIVYFSDDTTFALDPATNTWTNLKPSTHPACCRTLAWASMCYDPINDEMLLFGGGLATNAEGGAPTWLYDCRNNTWYRPELKLQPPLRCVAPIVYEPKNQVMVLFGGYDQAAALNDTWVYHCRTRRWERRTPDPSPPPMFAPAAAAVPGAGKILVCGANALTADRFHSATRADRETWVYDPAKDTWTPAGGNLRLLGYEWLTAAGAPRHGVVFLVAFGPERRTYAFRYDASGPAEKRPGAAPGSVAWKYPRQKQSLESAPKADPAGHAKFLAALPPNRFVDAAPPGTLVSKTWSTAVIDTDRSEVIYTGGGHSGYSGNDVAHYDVAANRWSLDAPPRFPPYLEATNATVFGWSYGLRPWSQHTYLWYSYDPVSRTVLYLARPTLFKGAEICLSEDPRERFVYDPAKHGHWSWVYDPGKRKMHKPSFGRPFDNPWHLSLAATPKGVYAVCHDRCYHARVDGQTGQVRWSLVDAQVPRPGAKIKYHYEFQPILYDSKRNRLLRLMGDSRTVVVQARPLAEGARWEQVSVTGSAEIGREAVYIEKHDTVLWLGYDRLFALDLATGNMAEPDVPLPKGSYGHECALVYDPRHDACVALVPSGFSAPMQTFLFRFDPKTVRYKPQPPGEATGR